MVMKPANIAAAAIEAKRFLKAEKAWRERMAAGGIYEFQGSKESGALRRASLDLTRALAEMRKP
jgi:hypothetical protein